MLSGLNRRESDEVDEWKPIALAYSEAVMVECANPTLYWLEITLGKLDEWNSATIASMFRMSYTEQLSLCTERCIPHFPVFIKTKIHLYSCWFKKGGEGVGTEERAEEGNEGNKERSKTKAKIFRGSHRWGGMQGRFTLSPPDKWYLEREMWQEWNDYKPKYKGTVNNSFHYPVFCFQNCNPFS